MVRYNGKATDVSFKESERNVRLIATEFFRFLTAQQLVFTDQIFYMYICDVVKPCKGFMLFYV